MKTLTILSGAAGLATGFVVACGAPSSGSGPSGLGPSGSGGATGSGGVLGLGAGNGFDSGTGNGGSLVSSGGFGGTPSGAGGTPTSSPDAGSSGGSAPVVNVCGDVFKDCNQNTADGCETNVNSDPNNCGACSNVCPGGNHSTGYCFLGACDTGCDAGWGDCNGDPADGCETDTLSDKNNCGACGSGCGDKDCLDGACECASTAIKVDLLPLDMYILFDQSGSMNDSVTGGTKWSVIKGALQSFVQNSASDGMGVGIGYFPQGGNVDCTQPNSGCLCIPFTTICFSNSAASCNPADYKEDVGVALLPGVATSIVNSLNAHSPGGGTPTYPALQGAYAYATSYAQAHPDRKTIVVLATDGNPTGCDTNNTVATIASNLVAPALAQTPSLLTFVVGVGSSLTSLNAIAAAGGTGQAFIVDTAGADPGGQFLAAMQKIQGSAALGCTYPIPSPPTGAPDFSKVNVKYTPSSGTASILRKVPDQASCAAAGGGWYYDNPSAPNQILLCDQSCTAVRSDSGAKVEVLLGCGTSG